MKKLSRIFCLLLTFVMVFSMISLSPVRAAEVPESETIPLETTTDDELTVTTPEEIEQEEPLLYATRAAYENGKYRPKAVVWSCNYEKIHYSYNGINYSSDRVLLNSVWIDDAFQTAYCIEPGRNLQAGSIYDDTEYTGADPWLLLDYSKQRGVSLAILYGYPNGINSDDLKTQIAYQLATSLIIHEIILGWREDTYPYTCLSDAYYDVFGGGTPEKPEKLQITSEYYSSVHTKYLNNEDVWFAYEHISNCLATHDLIPSFASKLENQAPSHTMVSNSDGTYSITLTDTNNILSAYDFENTDDLTFVKSEDGKSLTITTANSNLETVLAAPERIVPNSDQSAFLIWDAATGSQDMCTLHSPKYDPVPAFFKLKLPTGKVKIQKETSDGNCLSGWQFEIYSDAACTNLVSGPHTTDNNGQILLSDLQTGTYWVKEIGNTSATVNDLYYCEESVKEVTVSAGETAEVTFLNIVIPKGNLSVTKTTDSNTDIMGWKFALYYDEACENLAYGPVATNPNGIASFNDIMAGSYWIKEIGHTDAVLGSYYTCTSRNPQPITIIPDDTVNAYFYNTMNTGAIVIHKTDPYQNTLAGAHFLLEWSTSGTNWNTVTYSPTPGRGKCTTPGLKNGILVTGSSGNVSFEGLALGVYYRITEVKAPNGFQLLGDYAFEGMLNFKDEVITINVVNTPIFTLPHTGSHAMFGVTAGLTLCLLTCIGAVIYLNRKET